MTVKFDFSMPFKEAIEYIKGKIPVVSEHWADFTGEMHNRAFVIAGANKQEIVADFYTVITKAIEEGRSLSWFRKEFDTIVKTHGWSYNGSRGWRTKTIYQTNILQAYNAGREKQMDDPVIAKAFPYMKYQTSRLPNVRDQHRQWEGVILKDSDPWWENHTPMCGYNCHCSRRRVAPPAVEQTAPETKVTEWKNPRTGKTEKVYDGITPGFGKNPAQGAWGKAWNKSTIDKAAGEKRFTPINSASYKDYKRPDKIPQYASDTKPYADNAASEKQLYSYLKTVLKGDSAILTNPVGDKILITTALIDHILEDKEKRWNGRERYFPFIPELIQNPYEIWVEFYKDEITGKVSIRQKYVSMVKVTSKHTITVIAEVVNNMFVGLTFFTANGDKAANKIRTGRMIYGRK